MVTSPTWAINVPLPFLSPPPPPPLLMGRPWVPWGSPWAPGPKKGECEGAKPPHKKLRGVGGAKPPQQKRVGLGGRSPHLSASAQPLMSSCPKHRIGLIAVFWAASELWACRQRAWRIWKERDDWAKNDWANPRIYEIAMQIIKEQFAIPKQSWRTACAWHPSWVLCAAGAHLVRRIPGCVLGRDSGLNPIQYTRVYAGAQGSFYNGRNAQANRRNAQWLGRKAFLNGRKAQQQEWYHKHLPPSL